MELSQSALRGLQVAGLSSVDDKVFSKLSLYAVQTVLGAVDPDTIANDASLSKIDQSVSKEAFAGLSTLMVEAARTDSDGTSISSVLEDCKFTPDRTEALKTLYTEYKPQLRAALTRTGSSFPHIVDVDWRLDYYIKSNQLERVDKPVYMIGLKTEDPNSDTGSNDIQFACTQEQLQDLVSKLKDATKSLEKFSQ